MSLNGGTYQSLSMDSESGLHADTSLHSLRDASLSGSASHLDEESSYKDLMKQVVFGGIDGLSASVVLLSACMGGGIESRDISVIGLSGISALAMCMGAGEFLSARAHREFVSARYRQHSWDYKHNSKQNQMNSIIDKFFKKGLSQADAEAIVKRVVSNEKFFVSLLVSEDVGIQYPADNDAAVLLDALVLVLAFVLLGSIPVLVFTTRSYSSLAEHSLYNVAMMLALCLLLLLGCAKSIYSQVNAVYAGLEVAAVALACSLAANLLGSTLSTLSLV